MTNRQFAALLLKLISLYFLMLSLINLSQAFFYQSPMGDTNPQMLEMRKILFIQPITFLMASVAVAILSNPIANKLFPDERELQFPNITATDLQAILFATVGAYLLCGHSGNLAQIYSNFKQSEILSLSYKFEPVQNLILALPSILGFILLIYSMKFATILQKLRQRNPNEEV